MPHNQQSATQGIARMELRGVARNCHESFQITFDYGQSGTPYLTGARIIAAKQLNNGTQIETRMEVRAFGEIAEELATLEDGDILHIRGDYGRKKGKDGKTYYDIVTIDEVLEHTKP